MKNLKAFLCVVAFGAMLVFPADADAGLLKKILAKRQSNQTNNSTCNMVNGVCTIHGGGSTGTSVTGSGPVTAAELAAVGGVYYALSEPAAGSEPNPSAPTANGGHVTESERAPDVPAPSQETDVDAALSKVAELEAAIVEALKDVELAIADQEDAAERRALKQQQHIDRETNQLKSEIAALNDRLAALEPTPEK